MRWELKVTTKAKKWIKERSLKTINLLKRREVHQIIKLDVLFLLRKMLYIFFLFCSIRLFIYITFVFLQYVEETRYLFGIEIMEHQLEAVVINMKKLLVNIPLLFIPLMFFMSIYSNFSVSRKMWNTLVSLYSIIGLIFFLTVNQIIDYEYVSYVVYIWLSYQVVRKIENVYLKKLAREIIVDSVDGKIFVTSNIEQLLHHEKTIFSVSQNWKSFITELNNECTIERIYFDGWIEEEQEVRWRHKNEQCIKWKILYQLKGTFHKIAVNPWIIYRSSKKLEEEMKSRKENGEVLYPIDKDTFYVKDRFYVEKGF